MRNAFTALWGALLCVLVAMGGIAPANAQTAIQALVVTTCGTPLTTYTAGRPGAVTLDTTGTLCTAGGGGGGGGLSITDQAAFTQGTSKFTPGGGEFNDTTTLSSGQQGMLRLTTKRAQIVDTDTSGNALYSAITAAVPCLNATAFNTNSYSTGQTNPANCDLGGNLYVNSRNVSGSIASGAFASGSIGSGAVASGAIASGAVASGAFASGSIGSGAVASGAIASGAIASGAFAAGSFANATAGDPCLFAAKTNVSISMQNTTTIKLVSLAASQKIYICSLSLIASGATVFSVVDGTKSSTECDTAAEAVMGAAVAAHGLSLAANGGMTFGNGGSTVALTNTAAHDLCLFQSGSVDLSGNITYVQRVP